MYSANQIIKGLKNPSKAYCEGRRLAGRVQNYVRGQNLLKKDWDNLIILDACRYDTFKEINELDGELKQIRSNGSATPEFIKNSVLLNSFQDMVYVTANPYISIHADQKFHFISELWKEEWNYEYNTVMPETVVKKGQQVHSDFPNKRVVVHFMQPHHPFIGPQARSALQGLEGNKHVRDKILKNDAQNNSGHVWKKIKQGQIDEETVREAYVENTEIALKHAEKLAKNMSGKTVITSDHGNLFNEPAYTWGNYRCGRYGHPIYATSEPLVRVPWFTLPHKTRKSISESIQEDRGEKPGSGDSSDNSVEEKLEHLGYLQ